jgi:chromosome segregation ATPase
MEDRIEALEQKLTKIQEDLVWIVYLLEKISNTTQKVEKSIENLEESNQQAPSTSGMTVYNL